MDILYPLLSDQEPRQRAQLGGADDCAGKAMQFGGDGSGVVRPGVPLRQKVQCVRRLGGRGDLDESCVREPGAEEACALAECLGMYERGKATGEGGRGRTCS